MYNLRVFAKKKCQKKKHSRICKSKFHHEIQIPKNNHYLCLILSKIAFCNCFCFESMLSTQSCSWKWSFSDNRHFLASLAIFSNFFCKFINPQALAFKWAIFGQYRVKIDDFSTYLKINRLTRTSCTSSLQKRNGGRNDCLNFDKGTRQERVPLKWGTVNALECMYVFLEDTAAYKVSWVYLEF